ncbi:hypothetical protein D3C73_1507120 [compost metagenome]
MFCINFTIANTWKMTAQRLVSPHARAFEKDANFPQPFHLPLSTKTRQALLAGEELLHGGFLDVTLFGDQLIQAADQGVHVGKGCGDGALFYERRHWI